MEQDKKDAWAVYEVPSLLGEGCIVHVIPHHDEVFHRLSSTCECSPHLHLEGKEDTDPPIWVHKPVYYN